VIDDIKTFDVFAAAHTHGVENPGKMPSRPMRTVISGQRLNTITPSEPRVGMSLDGNYRTRLRYLRTRRATRLNAAEATTVPVQVEAERSRPHAAINTGSRWRRPRGTTGTTGTTGTSTGNTVKERLIFRLRPILSSWFHPSRPYDQDECFFPFPKISFLVDRAEGLLCQVCHVSRFQMRGSEEETLDDTTFSIMPCGHALGSVCLQHWLTKSDRCPICRYQLVYPTCGHRIQPRPITEEATHMLPPTLPDNGSVPDLCSLCLKAKLKKEAKLSFDTAVHEFQEARARFAVTGNPLDEEALFRRKSDFENTIRDEFHIKYITSWLSTW
jgi:hypothetical protein